MASSPTKSTTDDALLLPSISPSPPPHLHPHPLPQNYVILPFFYTSRQLRRRCHRNSLSLSTSIFLLTLLLALSTYLLWPSDPTLTIVRLKLIHFKAHTLPHLSVDISLAVTLKVRNRDAYSVDLSSLDVAVAYRGRELGHVTSTGGHVRAWGSSYVEAVAEFDRVDVVSDWAYLLDDLAKGTIPLDTVSVVNGRLGLFFIELPLKAKVSCGIEVHIKNQTISRQSCFT